MYKKLKSFFAQCMASWQAEISISSVLAFSTGKKHGRNLPVPPLIIYNFFSIKQV
jgi:hypothetical protein